MESTLIGPAGEHHVMSEPLRRRYIGALAPRGVPNADIVVTDIDGARACAIQVKTRRNISAQPPRMWLCLAVLIAGLFFAGSAGAQGTKIYEKVAASIELTPEEDFEPTVAILVAGELSCPSGRAFIIVMSCASQLTSAPDMAEAIVAECKRTQSKLGCHKTHQKQQVNVLAVYDMTIPGSAPQKRILAKVRAGAGENRYVCVASLDFWAR